MNVSYFFVVVGVEGRVERNGEKRREGGGEGRGSRAEERRGRRERGGTSDLTLPNERFLSALFSCRSRDDLLRKLKILFLEAAREE
jgi:hypothetical protein